MIADVTREVTKLSVSLVGEEVEIDMVKHGKRVTVTVTIGERVADFKSFVEKEESHLKELWAQWDEIQQEYEDLGIEVFGNNPAGEVARDIGYKKEMKVLDLEHEDAVEELNSEIEEMGEKILKRLKASEKVRQH